MITYFKNKDHKSKKNYKKYKMLTSISKYIDTFVIIAKPSNSIRLSLTGNGLMVIPILTGIACGLTNSNKILYEIFMQKYNRCKKQSQKNQQAVKSFDKIYRTSLQDKVL